MNTIKSTWLGWGVLCVAGGGAYYFAKKSINADRAARFDAEQKSKAYQRRLEESSYMSAPSTRSKVKFKSSADPANGTKGLDHAGSPSSEISEDAAPVGHAPVDQDQKIAQKSKYEGEPFRSKKGDRLS
ncbi:hypothetical protein EDD37DRAFT_652592 [Exophiala viscosa]|uniref:Uncharacterized protein n=1 Tax=Exophiala viscosa TaxID=2486360 RepID=A0AAN6E219_9EURO|nr:hypothetical protein EDD36DRAFT_462733 [Exophiala viscosa]KAI1622244.1 hypothetical protein EDD37DRAFT_652592 [Exophiala viscosa]